MFFYRRPPAVQCQLFLSRVTAMKMSNPVTAIDERMMRAYTQLGVRLTSVVAMGAVVGGISCAGRRRVPF